MQNSAQTPEQLELRETFPVEFPKVEPDMQNLWRQLWLCIGQLKRELRESPSELCWDRPQALLPPFRLLGEEKKEKQNLRTTVAPRDSATAKIPQHLQNISQNGLQLNQFECNSLNVSAFPKVGEEVVPQIDNSEDGHWWKAVEHCQSCQLGHEATRIREQSISGYPHIEQAKSVQVLLVCDAPSYDAEQLGQPLSKDSLDYLLKWLKAIELQDGYYLTNLVKCRTPGGRAAWPEEIKSCTQHLHAQLRFFAPRAILALGGSAARSLSARRENLESLREQELFYEFGIHRIRLFVTYAVSEVLQNPKELRPPVWQDLKRLRTFLQNQT